MIEMSSYTDPTSSSVAHCEAMEALFPDLAESYYRKISQYCQQKLWHQLTLLALDFVQNQGTTLRALSTEHKNTFVALYREVILVVAQKLNALALGRIAAQVAFASLHQGGTVDESKAILEEAMNKTDSGKPNASATVMFLQSKIGLLQLQNTPEATKEALSSVYSTIKTNAPLLQQIMPDTPEAMIVHSSHLEMSMTYYKLIGPPEAYYEEAINYLNYYTPTEANKANSHALAVDLCLAALTGEGVFNLGQVVTNPVLQVLAGTPEHWLMELLQVCAKGDVTAFKTLCTQTYPSQIASQPALVNMSRQMQEKITLLALVEMVFERPASQRTLEFSEIAERLEIPLEQVEWVIMRAFSVKLMEGSMDQVDGTVHVTWVLPRTLSNDQMTDLATRFGDWAAKVRNAQTYMQEHATLVS